MTHLRNLITAAVLVISSVTATAQTASPSPEIPQAIKRCVGCHSMDVSRSSPGPHLVKVIGRRAGSVRRGTYGSVQAAVDQGVIWDEGKLVALLSGTPPFDQRGPHFVGKPPTHRESDAAAIREIVDFLKTK
jgi:cytochrome c